MVKVPKTKPKKPVRRPSMDQITTDRKSTINKKRSVSATDIREATEANEFDALQRRIDAMPDGNIKKAMQKMLDAQVTKFEAKQARDADMATVRQQNAARANKMKGKVSTSDVPFDIPEEGSVKKVKGLAKGGATMGFNAGGVASRKGSYDYRKGGYFK